ncbi:Hypothetical protein BFG00_2104 [Corynebacterium pseudotuberculosis]|nr:Hypothetical protein BFF96_2122 [Corynebacterium pseudotuberculosis]AUY61486.1 Hypothetical protein BFG00_2104 [Corynebacterium pseudotuberculosis]
MSICYRGWPADGPFAFECVLLVLFGVRFYIVVQSDLGD